MLWAVAKRGSFKFVLYGEGESVFYYMVGERIGSYELFRSIRRKINCLIIREMGELCITVRNR